MSSHQPLHIDPDEVKAHLRNIFGSDFKITEDQLQAFIKDLKKLIRKDLKHSESNKENRQHFCDEVAVNETETSCSDFSLPITSNYDAVNQQAEVIKGRPSSFIRPWRLQKATNKKSDPVGLYQKYQKIWKRHCLPGENSHSQLRWSIREKMLGQNPQAPPMSASSTHSLDRNKNFY